jgi:hypothetical protein
MTKALEHAFRAASSLSEAAQNALATAILEEISAEQRSVPAAAQDEGALTRLANQALEDEAAGRTETLDLERLAGSGVDPRATHVAITDDEISVVLADGRRLAVPLAWSPRLLDAQPDQRQRYQLMGGGRGIHWPDLDEDLSVEGLLRGTPPPVRGRSSAQPGSGT